MPQQIVVSKLKKQITSKKSTLENALKEIEVMRKKREADVAKNDADYKKAYADWEVAVQAIAQSITLNKDNSSVEHRYYQGSNTTVSITIPSKKLPKRPEPKQLKWSDYDVVVPVYYDAYNRIVDSRAVLAHLNKALEMLDVLPDGTIEVTVKDFNFLTKF
jgi:hypothetical protein